MVATDDTTTGTSRPATQGHHPGKALALIAGAQLMIVLDATIVNVALPHIQTALGFSSVGLTWVLNAYTLTFGGLLLLGGRAGDILGRRRMFVLGLLVFVGASLLGGFATSPGWLLTCRAVQGVGGAICSPTALALITTNFAEGPERNRAFGVFAAVSGSGAAIGLVAGGMLTSWLSWRWVLFVNVPIGLAIVALVRRYVDESRPQPGQFDVPGAVLSTLGMTALVYGFIHAASDGWADTWTLASFVAAAVLLALFVAAELRTRQPVVPLGMFANRNRAASYAVMFLVAAGLFSMFYFLTLFVQNVLGYSPLKAGFAFLPVSACIVISAQAASIFLIRVGPKPLMALGGLLGAAGLFWLSRISEDSSYVGGLLGPIIVFALGMGLLFVPVTITAVAAVRAEDTGAASALLNVMQQVGGTVGLAVLTTIFSSSSRNETNRLLPDFLRGASAAQRQAVGQGHLPPQVANPVLAHGISTSLQMSVVFMVVAFVIVLVGVTLRRQDVAGATPGAMH